MTDRAASDAIRDALARRDTAAARRILDAAMAAGPVAPAPAAALPLPEVPVRPPSPPKAKPKGKGKVRTPAEVDAGQAAQQTIALLCSTLAASRSREPHNRWPAEPLAPVARGVPPLAAAGRLLARAFHDDRQARTPGDPDALTPELVAAAVWREVLRLRRPVRLTRQTMDELLRRVMTSAYSTVELHRSDRTGTEWFTVATGLTRYQDSTTHHTSDDTDDGPVEAWLDTDPEPDDDDLEAW